MVLKNSSTGEGHSPGDDAPFVFKVLGRRESGPPGALARGAAGTDSGDAASHGDFIALAAAPARGSAGAAQEFELHALPGRDLVRLHLAGGPVLTLHPQHARDLLAAQAGARSTASALPGQRGGKPAAASSASSSNRSDIARDREVPVQAALRWPGAPSEPAQRGAVQAALAAIEVVARPLAGGVADAAAAEVVRHFDGQVDPGLYALGPQALGSFKGSGAAIDVAPEAPGQAILVLVHGTFSDAQGTFGDLWRQHPELVRALFARYGAHVYAFEHPTLGTSPVGNALALARALPHGARVHLLTHSRGGLVAEALARACGVGAAPRPDADEPAFDDPDLDALLAAGRERGLQIERIVRVACPARGTLLASNRLDAYLSIVEWTLRLAGVPVLPAFVALLEAIARHRTDPSRIPGLAAQMPDSAFMQWLHGEAVPLPGSLRVVAGDMQGDSLSSWLKTLMSDAYYWTDNDLVVQTRSMYGGLPRQGSAGFMLDRGGEVSHFGYFAHASTANALVQALLQEGDGLPQGFQPIGPLSWAGESAEGTRAARSGPAPDRPAVFVLPGILGSNLKRDGHRVWLGWRIVAGLKTLSYLPDGKDGIEPDGPVDASYGKLLDFLSRTHEVVPFGFDWRRPLQECAHLLAAAVEEALDARRQTGQPVRLLAHSMGGLLARMLQIEAPATWERLFAHRDARLVMLGTPNHGSWAPMQVLSGDDSFCNLLVAVGAPFQDASARRMMAAFPGFLQLQAGLSDSALGLAQEATWKRLAEQDLAAVREYSTWHSDWRQITAFQWGVPPQAVLDAAVATWSALDAQAAAGAHAPWAGRRGVLVVGHADFTPEGFALGGEGLMYGHAEDGDGRVPLHSALLEGVPTWRAACSHGDLASHEDAFAAYEELLREGATARLPVLDAAPADSAPRGVDASGAFRPSRGMRPALAAAALPPWPDGTPPASLEDVLRGRPAEAAAAPETVGTPLHVSVLNADLRVVREPLMIGHYRATVLTGTELAVDRRFSGALARALRLGDYAGEPGTHRVFVMGDGRTVVVGLGDEGKLAAGDLQATVQHGAIGMALRMAESQLAPAGPLELAAALIGSGGSGVSVGQSATLLVQGVRVANERLRAMGCTPVGRLRIVELYLDRATEAWRAVSSLAHDLPGQLEVLPVIEFAAGALRAPLQSNYRGAGYDYVSVSSGSGGTQGDEGAGIVFMLDTHRARTEVRSRACQTPLLRELMRSASGEAGSGGEIGRALFQLLVPPELEPFMTGSNDLLMELDAGTAALPWEMLEAASAASGTPLGIAVDDAGDRRPWAIRTRLVRKLRTSKFRDRPLDSGLQANALVIGAPRCDPASYPPLPGARAEAQAVAALLRSDAALGSDRVKLLAASRDGDEGPDARSVITSLLERPWRIVHVCGHGAAADASDPRGVVLSNGTWLGARELGSMHSVPELVFVNCCHLAARPDSSLLVPGDGRVAFAADAASQLIEIGVRCVVAAGWAVDDAAALRFASAFYDALLRGHRFMDAVGLAREAAWDEGRSDSTWAAYQCYGDPDWTLRRAAPTGGDLPSASRSGGVQASDLAANFERRYGGIASPQALVLALETLAIQSGAVAGIAPADAAAADRGAGESANAKEGAAADVAYLESRFAALWGGMGAVAEAFAVAWQAAGRQAQAADWYRRAVQAEDGSATMRAARALQVLASCPTSTCT